MYALTCWWMRNEGCPPHTKVFLRHWTLEHGNSPKDYYQGVPETTNIGMVIYQKLGTVEEYALESRILKKGSVCSLAMYSNFPLWIPKWWVKEFTLIFQLCSTPIAQALQKCCVVLCVWEDGNAKLHNIFPQILVWPVWPLNLPWRLLN